MDLKTEVLTSVFTLSVGLNGGQHFFSPFTSAEFFALGNTN